MKADSIFPWNFDFTGWGVKKSIFGHFHPLWAVGVVTGHFPWSFKGRFWFFYTLDRPETLGIGDLMASLKSDTPHCAREEQDWSCSYWRLTHAFIDLDHLPLSIRSYFNRLVAAREKSGTDPARIGAAHEDLMYNGETLRTGGKAPPVVPTQPAGTLRHIGRKLNKADRHKSRAYTGTTTTITDSQ